jgi:CHRD domain
MRAPLYCAAVLGAVAALCCHVETAAAGPLVFTANLTAGQVVSSPPSTSTATGFATVVLQATPGTTTIPYTVTTDLSWSGLSGPADRSHLHSAPPGQPTNGDFFHEVLYIWWPSDPQGPAVDCFAGTGACVPATGSTHDVVQIDASNIASYVDYATLVSLFDSGGMYIDIHDEQYPDGEIRGQFVAASIREPAGIGVLALAGVLAASLRRPSRSRRSK